MFYCDDCRKKNNWPESFIRSRGKCELCGAQASCNDVSSSRLPLPPDAHVTKAMELFGVDQYGVTPEMRLVGKAWNFGAAFGATDEKVFGALIDNDMISTEDGARILVAKFGRHPRPIIDVDYADLERRIFATLPQGSPMRKAIEAVPVTVEPEKVQRLRPPSDTFWGPAPNCHACKNSYMGPSDERLVCGVSETYADRASAEGGHCGPTRPKFEQHPMRNRDGTLKP